MLGDLPIVGTLFRGEVRTETNTELVIFITPRILTGAALSDEQKRKLLEQSGATSEKPAY